MSQEKIQFQPPHPLNEKEKQFLNSSSQQTKELFKLATEMLGSSHFVGKTHGFTAWSRSSGSSSNPTQQSPAAK